MLVVPTLDRANGRSGVIRVSEPVDNLWFWREKLVVTVSRSVILERDDLACNINGLAFEAIGFAFAGNCFVDLASG